MSLGKLTLLSADCDGSGAVVGSSAMVADSSGAEGAGCAAPVGRAPGGAFVAAGVSAAPGRMTPLRVITQINRLFGIAHHSKAYGCTRTIRAITPGQTQIRRAGGPPVWTAYDVTSAILGA